MYSAMIVDDEPDILNLLESVFAAQVTKDDLAKTVDFVILERARGVHIAHTLQAG